MFIAALFTIAKMWKQPTCPPVDEWIKKAALQLRNGTLPSSEKGETLTFCNSMDGCGENFAK